MKGLVKQAVNEALRACAASGQLAGADVPDFVVEVPNRVEHGDFAVNVAMLLARAERKAPRQIAELLAQQLRCREDLWLSVEVAGPGFINLRLQPQLWFGVLETIHCQQQDYGRATIGAGQRVQVEFVSANPTGPLHIGHGRGAATGDAVAAVLQEAGYSVQREYYINDAGNQMDTLGRSILLRYRQQRGEALDFPADCYQGDYIVELAEQLFQEEGARLLQLPEVDAIRYCARWGGDIIRAGIDADLQDFGVHFDNWYSEQSLYDRELVAEGIEALRQAGHVYEQDGALWLRTTSYGDDKDRVLVRSNGATTYFASDVAYHREKYQRGFNRVIDVWGADHHGYVPRMKAVLQALGRDPQDLHIILVQLVNLLRAGQQVAMSTRAGTFVTLREVLDEVGRDACRFFFLMRRGDSQLDFDLELAKQQSNDNPVFYVQYAHARICSIKRNAAEAGLVLEGTPDCAALRLEEELALARLLERYPEVICTAAQHYEPHRLTFYVQELAAAFHSYYNQQRILVEDEAISRARLYLAEAVRQVLANGLRVLGVAAPQKM
ncbi:arginine--tRNA ligase [Desulfuromonas thiophila]|uniref:Arginine--tRNA ligase n=1 Tax=Desulfuromonas thiophila TaxID=57664 RepID=A0A1G6YTQ0_9BACT|nr:arginine--tRNA ligase [Desulfuromonas thiophila]SDD93884.1 arginyl-tRNA synthetase [Desulfuromonas thiophila]